MFGVQVSTYGRDKGKRMIHIYDLVEVLESGAKRLKCRSCSREIKVTPKGVKVENAGEPYQHSWSISWMSLDAEAKDENE